jgi:mannitol/fructose-specific phosphotransferase system IIA component (Ntr-type)
MCELNTTGNALIVLGLEATTEEGVIKELIRALIGRPEVLDWQALERAVLRRQQLQTPLLDNGVALPHARSGTVSEIVMAIGRCAEPVAFGPEQVPVRLVFLFGVPAHCIGEYLAAVARLVRSLKRPGTLEALLAAQDEAEVRRILD